VLSVFLPITTTACYQTSASLENSPPQAASTPAVQLAQNPTQGKNLIPTEQLSPQPIRINLQNLPAPFATNSASKSPQVVSIPQKPVLKVPPGFTVNVFAENLNAPRWLALTPSGDVLVTETRQNRIRLLRDTDGDGVADVRQTFASAKMG